VLDTFYLSFSGEVKVSVQTAKLRREMTDNEGRRIEEARSNVFLLLLCTHEGMWWESGGGGRGAMDICVAEKKMIEVDEEIPKRYVADRNRKW
jgi:hypothetical protein